MKEINGIVGAFIRSTPDDEVRRRFDADGVAYGFVLSVEDIANDPQYLANKSFVTVEHPRMGPLKMQNVLPRMSGTPSSPINVAPELGADTDEVLMGLLGLSADRIADLRGRGIC